MARGRPGENQKTEAQPLRENRPDSVFVRIGTWFLFFSAVAAAVSLLFLLLRWGSAGLTLILMVLLAAVLISGIKR